MQAVIVEKVGSYVVGEVDRREPGRGEVLIRVEVTGLCRTDLKIIRHGHRDLVTPRVPGEEVVGIVGSVGPETDVAWLGERVYVYPGTSCGHCGACCSGAENLCADMRIMGFHRDGGFAEWVIAPAAGLIRVPEGLTSEEAVFVEPLSCCLNALELGRLQSGETVGIWGAGPAGVLLHRACVALGARPSLVEQDPHRREMTAAAAAPLLPGFDVAVVACGDPTAYAEALTHLRPRGRLVVFSGLLKGQSVLPVDLNELHYQEQTLVGAYGCSFRHGVQALDLLSSGQVLVNDLISHRMRLDELEEALAVVEERRGMKVHLYPRSEETS